MTTLRFRIGAAVTVACAATAAVAAVATHERYELSAPLLPQHVTVFEARSGENYPTTLAEKEQLTRDGVLTFSALLTACAEFYPEITLAAAGETLTNEQLSRNYNGVARCAYERYGSKPYWIPQLIDDVDVCALSLGAGWRLLSEDDLLSLDEADFQYLHDTLHSIPAGEDSWWGGNHFATDIYVRAADGSLARGSLQPGVTPRVQPIVQAWEGQGGVGNNRTQHYEGNLGLRCIRRTLVVH